MCGESGGKCRCTLLLQKWNALGGPPPRAETSTGFQVLFCIPGDANSQVVRGNMRYTKAALTFPSRPLAFQLPLLRQLVTGVEVSSVQNSRPAANLRSTEAAEKGFSVPNTPSLKNREPNAA